MAAVVSLRDVSRRYVRGTQHVQALRDIDLDIEAGASVALLGPPGSGKTTLLHVIAGLDAPDAGTVLVSGVRIDTLASRDLAYWRTRHVGLVFPTDHLVPTLTVERNVEIPVLATELSRYERRRAVFAALDAVGLTRCAQCLPDPLSLRQRRRVAIARALVTQPALLVCDDPPEDVLEALHDVNEQLGTTVVMATDDPLAASSASRVLHVDEGRVESARLAQAAA
jgi:putative ABC transport system ATP-binding protein